MLQFSVSNVHNQSPLYMREFYILGDGDSKLIEIDLTKSPVGISFVGNNLPKTAFIHSIDSSDNVHLTVKANMSGCTLQLDFSEIIKLNKIVTVKILFFY